MKKCSKCKVEKPLVAFNKNSLAKSGLDYWCKVCKAASSHEFRVKNPEKQRAIVSRTWLKHAYGITPEGKEALVLLQGGRCAVCDNPFPSPFHTHVDHIHGSDPVEIRGILCWHCNVGLGNFKDSPERLMKAAAYLKKFQKTS